MMKSFIPVAPDSHFPIQNLPYGVFRTTKRSVRIGVAIGDFILDLREAEEHGLFRDIEGLPEGVFREHYLNSFMRCGRAVWSAVRGRLQAILGEESVELRDDEGLRAKLLVSRSIATMLMPVKIGDYTDFYASLEHATNVGTMFRGAKDALQPNWKHLPVGYHGRASSIFTNGGSVRRPMGQILVDGAPVLAASQKLDFEMETAFFVGVGNRSGERILAERAVDHVFGMVLMNDWSARDIQKWEYVPLGPFLGKNFYTSISPWVVTMDALEPFRVQEPQQDPQPLEYLRTTGPNAYDIQLEVKLKSASCDEYTTVCRTNQKFLYWTMAQQLAHHTINGCNMMPGDLLGSGTISGPTSTSMGCLLELTQDGKQPFRLSGGSERTYLQDGDTVKMSGFAQGHGYRVGFGELVNTIEASI
ncbi:MAG TPA: fumarylacetoacetase [Bacteroidetes bacterium]|nr:fumarylacetoacetase [Bacteroidota bacterium]